MKQKRILILLAILVLLIALAQSNSIISAQSGGTYDLTWNTIGGGGTMSASGGTYTLSGTIGQSEAGMVSGGPYALNGGFWGLFESLSKLFLPLLRR